MKIKKPILSILDHYLAYGLFFIGVPNMITELIKVLCDWSEFLNFDWGKEIEWKNDSTELTDLENGVLSS